jgi:hypothetical protein
VWASLLTSGNVKEKIQRTGPMPYIFFGQASQNKYAQSRPMLLSYTAESCVTYESIYVYLYTYIPVYLLRSYIYGHRHSFFTFLHYGISNE